MPMWHGDGWMLGMHYSWWIFWLALIIVVALLLARRQPPGTPGTLTSQPTALQILERRYAAGEISTQEFEERKAKLLGITR